MPRSLLMPGDGSFRPSGLAAVPVGTGGRMLPARGTRSSGNGGSAVPVSCMGSARQRTGKGLRWLLGGRECECPGSPLRAGRGERGLSRRRGSGALTFLHAGAERPPRLALPVFEQSFPDRIWGKKGARVGWREGWSQAGPRPPSAHPRAASPQPPAAPPRLPRRCGEARKRVQVKGNPISDPAGEAFK